MKKLLVAPPGQSLKPKLIDHTTANSQLKRFIKPMGMIEVSFATAKKIFSVYPPNARHFTGSQFSSIREFMLSDMEWRTATRNLLNLSSGDNAFNAKDDDLNKITTPFWNDVVVASFQSQCKVQGNLFTFDTLPMHSLAVDLWRKDNMAAFGMLTFSIYVIVLTLDAEVVIGKRWSSGARPGMLMTASAGSLRWDERSPYSELYRELGIGPYDFVNPPKLFAITEYTRENLLNIWYLAEPNLTSGQVVARWSIAQDRYEHEGLVFYPLLEINEFLKQHDQRNMGNLVNVGAGGLWCLLEHLGLERDPTANPFEN
ncbi:MAG: hypothetical protein WC659_05970 [Patescibacteria group bacterium]